MTHPAQSVGQETRVKDLPALDDARARCWADLVAQRAGIIISAERWPFLAAGLRARMTECGVSSYDAYYRLLSGNPACTEEWARLIDRLTVHETSFFRHAPSLDLLRREALPRFLEGREGRIRGYQAWSVGCATGEEAYTLAMLIRECFDESVEAIRFGITATDISRPALKVAREGVYSERRLKDVPPALRERYCLPHRDGRWQIAAELRSRICFAQINVLEAARFPLRDLDLVFCQNMLIYFPRVSRLQIVEVLARRIAPQGMLVLGPGDMPCWSHPEFKRVQFEGTLAFQRVAAGTASV